MAKKKREYEPTRLQFYVRRVVCLRAMPPYQPNYS